jgi:hypothetical protein
MQFKRLYTWIFLISLLLSACQNNSKEESSIFTKEELRLDDTLLVENKDPANELYIIEGKAVIFFIVSKKEMEKLNRELGSSYRYETDMLFNNFMRQAENFRKILAKHNIQSELARNKRFLIKLKNGQTINFNRIREDQIMGEIITNGQKEPVIEFGMFSNRALIALIEDYFNVKNIGTIHEPKPIYLPDEENNQTDSSIIDNNLLTDTISY